MKKCIRNATTSGMVDLLKKIHFDDEHPENQNIRLKSLKRELMEIVKDDQKWHLMDKTEALNKLMRKLTVAMSSFYHKELADDDEDGFRADMLRKVAAKNTNPFYVARKSLNVVIIDEYTQRK
jgi:hypothetical protein